MTEGAADPWQAALDAHHNGDLSQAEALYRTLLVRDPRHVPALLHLGPLLLQQGRIAEGVALCRTAVDVAPDVAEAHANLATALSLQGDNPAAVAVYETALALDPELPEANYGLGSSLSGMQRYDEAVACYQRALSIDPEYLEAELGAGAAFQDMRRYHDAIRHYRNALALDPDCVPARHGLGSALHAMDRHAEAADAYRAVLTLESDHRATLLGLAAVLQEQGRLHDALLLLRRALEQRTDADGLLRYGHLLQEMGATEQAKQHYAAAIACAPNDPAGYLAWFNAAPVTPDDPALTAAEALAASMDELSPAAQTMLHFALGKACSDLRRHDEAFQHALAGNALQRQAIHYAERDVLRALTRTAVLFSPTILGVPRPVAREGLRPIFIIGMPNCGATLLEQILASHPAVFAGGARGEFGDAVEAVFGGPGKPAYPDLLGSITAESLAALGDDYLNRLHDIVALDGKAQVTHATDRRLENFALAGLIYLAVPQARIIHLRRDPIDTCLSCFSTLFRTVPYTSDLGELGRYCRACQQLMAHWRALLPDGSMLEVRYEDVMADIEGQTRRVLAYCGLSWDDACLSSETTESAGHTARMSQERRPLDRTSIDRWCPSDDLLRPLLDALGSG